MLHHCKRSITLQKVPRYVWFNTTSCRARKDMFKRRMFVNAFICPQLLHDRVVVVTFTIGTLHEFVDPVL